MVWKRSILLPNPGTSQKVGTEDYNKIIDFLDAGVDVDTATIDSPIAILNGKLTIASFTNVDLITVPNGPTTLIGDDTTDTLSNKQLTDPKITNNSTGSGTADLSTNCPAVDPSTPYVWLKMKSSDGSDVWIPAFK
jgi:hypothetical protein